MAENVMRIRSYQHGDAATFRDINFDWISRFFVVEAKDLEVLNDPEVTILDAGGVIFIAELDGAAVGTAALIPYAEGVVELAKMGVRPSAQGKGIGQALVRTAVDAARAMEMRSVYLETNSALATAIRIYRAAGFQHVAPLQPTPYARADVFMELRL